MAKRYDPILCMMVEDTVATKDSMSDLHGAIPVGKGYVKVRGYDFAVYNAKGELKGTYTSPDEAEEAARNLDEKPKNAASDADPIQQRKHEIVVKTENYLRSLGKSNSVGKYDRVVQGVKNLLYQGFLEGADLDRAIKQEADKLIKKYNLNDECPEGMTCDEKAYSVSYKKGNGPYQSIGVMANSESEAVEKFKKHLASKKQEAEIFGASIGESLETMRRKGKPVLDARTIDAAIRMCEE